MGARREFGGRIGRDWRDSEPWWPPDPTPPEGAPNVVLVVLDDVGFAQLGCYGSDIATPTHRRPGRRGRPAGQLPHDRAVLAHPGLPAHRAQPPPQRDGPGGRPGLRLPRATGASRPRRTAFSRRSCGRTATPPTPSGNGISRPDDETHMARLPRHLAARPGVRPLVRLPRGGDPPVRPRPLPRQPLGPTRPAPSTTATT